MADLTTSRTPSPDPCSDFRSPSTERVPEISHSRNGDPKLESRDEWYEEVVVCEVCRNPRSERALDPLITRRSERNAAKSFFLYLRRRINMCGRVPLLPSPGDGRKTLVLDLDETLVHSEFMRPEDGDFFEIDLRAEGCCRKIWVKKRPGVDEFLIEASRMFELVIFTASLPKYANPVLDKLDKDRVISARIFRDGCTKFRGALVKDLSRLGRDLSGCIIMDNFPFSYWFQPGNALPIDTWTGDVSDKGLHKHLSTLKRLHSSSDVRPLLAKCDGHMGFRV